MSSRRKFLVFTFGVVLLAYLVMLSTMSVKADSNEPISFSSGLAVYSPLNTTYNSYSVLANVSLGVPYGMGSSGLNYSIDGKYQDGINMHFPNYSSLGWGRSIPNYSPSNYYLFGSFYLPPLPNGPHQISFEIGVEADNYTAPPSSSFQRINGTNNYVATWVNTVSFTINSNDVFPTPTPTLIPTLTPTITPTATPTVPEFPMLAILTFFVSVLFVAVILTLRKQGMQKLTA
jgi:hypothetical protein